MPTKISESSSISDRLPRNPQATASTSTAVVTTAPRPSWQPKSTSVSANVAIRLGFASLVVSGILLWSLGWFGVGSAIMTLLVSWVSVVICYRLRRFIRYVAVCFIGGTILGAVIGAALGTIGYAAASAISLMIGQILRLESGIIAAVTGAALLGYLGCCLGAIYCGVSISENASQNWTFGRLVEHVWTESGASQLPINKLWRK